MDTLLRIFYAAKYWFADQRGKSDALCVAASKGNLAEVRFLLAHGAWVDLRSVFGMQPLHYAVSGGYRRVAEVLVEHGAQVGAMAIFGNGMLHIAAREGHKDVVELLLEKGADPAVANRDGKTPRALCSDEGIRALLQEAERKQDPAVQEREALAAHLARQRKLGRLRKPAPSL